MQPCRGMVVDRPRVWALLALAAFLAALIAPNLYAVSDRVGNELSTVAAVAHAAAFWLLWFALFRRVWLAVLAAALLCLWLWPFEIYLRTRFGTSLESTSIAFAAETHPGELAEFIRAVGDVLAALPWVIALALATLVLAWRTQLAWTHRSRGWLALGLPALMLASHLAFESQFSGLGLKPSADPFRQQPLSYWGLQWRHVFPLDLPFALDEYLADRHRVELLRRRIEGTSFGARRQQAGADVVVLVIGESSRADRWSLAGYARETNPLLRREPGLIFFDDVVTRSTATRTAVPSIVARQPVLLADGTSNPEVEPSFLRALAEVGYSTHWFSNQGGTGFFDTSSIFHARDAQDLRMLNPTSFVSRGAWDDTLLAPLDEALASPTPTAVVLHTMGSHFDFRHRYPAAYDRFRPSLQDVQDERALLAADRAEIGNAYDNTIVYTDHLLHEVIARVRATGRRGAVLYVADHGVDLPAPGCDYADVEGRASVEAYRVPALVWLSDALRAGRPELAPALLARRSAPLVNDFAFPTLLDLAGVGVPALARPGSAASVLDPAPRPRRIYARPGGWLDYDDTAGHRRCKLAPG